MLPCDSISAVSCVQFSIKKKRDSTVFTSETCCEMLMLKSLVRSNSSITCVFQSAVEPYVECLFYVLSLLS